MTSDLLGGRLIPDLLCELNTLIILCTTTPTMVSATLRVITIPLFTQDRVQDECHPDHPDLWVGHQ